MKTIKMLFIGFILGITSILVWQQYFEIIPRYSVDSNDIKGLAWQVARRYHVDATLLFAIIDQESQWNSNAISPKGAIGLMQILPVTGESECGFTEEQLFNPQLNLIVALATLLNCSNNLAQYGWPYAHTTPDQNELPSWDVVLNSQKPFATPKIFLPLGREENNYER